ncbi:uncharacterized protein A4U43_C03F22310 [Asparagus officinalis]|uniref:H/ACA ribonucleoprotein complex non-core subunit NAF1 n=1 Tax=Asparagus officinalis TaxID=4686 RepID=A0A5P1FD25_ASPOF|nr:uncharacterized protein A4U43_C03F22310 [Asparagus officinalis]
MDSKPDPHLSNPNRGPIKPTMESDTPKHSDDFSSRSIQLGHQNPIFEAPVDEKMEKVSLIESKMDPNCTVDDVGYVGLLGEVKDDGVGDGVKEAKSIGEEIGEDSSSESSSSSLLRVAVMRMKNLRASVRKDDDDNEGNEIGEEIGAEEGEENGEDIEDAVSGSSDGEGAVPKGPIKSKHEIEDLPPVPLVELSLEQHHQTLPVGFVSSILGNRAIVDGSEQHSPLNEGSILWITETRLPLGRIDEIFGPVKNPYYIVRYNSEKEVPPGISVGTAISFVIAFASHILNEKHLYQKGYDASGLDDEEVADDVEFSDDEKEAEYKRSLRQNKRDTNHGNLQAGFSKKKATSKSGGFHKAKQQPPANQPGQVRASPAAAKFGCGSNLNFAYGAANLGSMAPSRTLEPAFPPQPQNMAIQGGLPMNWLAAHQFGNQVYNLQHENQFFNNFPSGIMPYHHQHLVLNAGVLPTNFSALVGLMSQGGLGQVPFGCDPHCSMALSSEQSYVQAPLFVNQDVC